MSWIKNHRRRAASISRAFVKHGSKGWTIKGRRGFLKRQPWVS